MKKTLFITILLIGVVFNSCKKADFSELHSNFPGKWDCESSTTGNGIYFIFSEDHNLKFVDLGDGSSVEDDVTVSQTARIFNDIIKLGQYRFKIEEYPVRFDTVINRGGFIIQTKWRIKLKIGYAFYTSKKWRAERVQSFFKE